jgi:hypothetical protein
MCSGPKRAIFESRLELAPDVVTASETITKRIEKFLYNGKRVLGAIGGISGRLK